MELGRVVARRRMIRNYRDEPVAPATVERIVDLARRGPSAGYSQGQYFVVVSDPRMRSQIADLADEDEYVNMGFPPWISRAPIHIVVCASESDYRARYNEPDKLRPDGREIDWPVPYWYVDAGAALMLLLLGAVDEGLGAGFFGVHRLDGLKELLGIPPEVQPIGIVTLGHPAEEQRAGSSTRGRRPIEAAVRWERW